MKIYFYYFALLGGLLLGLAACQDDDEPSGKIELKTEEEAPMPTEDALEVTTYLPTYFFPATYSHTAGALERRIKSPVPAVDENTKLYILPGSACGPMSVEEAKPLTRLFLRGGHIVLVEPTSDDVLNFFFTLLFTAHDMLEKNEVEEETSEGIYAAFYSLSNLLQNSNLEFFLGEEGSDEVVCDLMAFRGNAIYVVGDLDDVVDTATEVTTTTVDLESDEVLSEVTAKDESPKELNDYRYGKQADLLVEWLEEGSDPARAQQALLREGRDQWVQTKGDFSLDEITSAQQITYSFDAWYTYYHAPVRVAYKIWTVNDGKQTDYYLIHQEIRSENSVLGCGPSDPELWLAGEIARKSMGGEYCYGPYMVQLATQVEFSDSRVEVEEASPANNISDVTNYSEGFDWGIDAGLSLGKDPLFNIGGSFSFSKSWSYDIEHLGMTFSYNGNRPKWDYQAGILPDTHFGLFHITHDIASPIMRNDCTVGQSWIWKIKDASGSYKFTSTTWLGIQGFYLEEHVFSTSAVYKTHISKDTRSFTLNAPPRYEQKWIMMVTPSDGNVKEFFQTYFPEYGDQAFSVYVVEKDDRSSIDARINMVKNRIKTNQVVLENEGITSFKISWKPVDNPSIYKTFTYPDDL